jgi:hypothetical protein
MLDSKNSGVRLVTYNCSRGKVVYNFFPSMSNQKERETEIAFFISLAYCDTTPTKSSRWLFSAIILTMALPTTMPSAKGASSLACWGVEMPKPIAKGSVSPS